MYCDPRYHWGDTDSHGVQILKSLQNCVPGRIIIPHLMDIGDGGADYSASEIKSFVRMTPVNDVVDALISSLVKRGKGFAEQETISAVSPIRNLF